MGETPLMRIVTMANSIVSDVLMRSTLARGNDLL